ncbi:DUF1405 domain-containing protein [Gordoniibacillus kamchatkensis]|nr:DUF1405 domain-containing protein [Paenibacillus sp. VKM B-2647]
MNRFLLWSLFWINLLGTIYGYFWYGDQLKLTLHTEPLWYLPFVPDSPTASLFFTMSTLYLLYEGKFGWSAGKAASRIRGFIEAFALITSFKYGIWAVSMIGASAALGNALDWQDYMLSTSHLGMAAEALLFARLYRFRLVDIALVACWSFANDYMDYGKLTYPWLPDVLNERLHGVEEFTVGLSVASILTALLCLPFNRASRERKNG